MNSVWQTFDQADAAARTAHAARIAAIVQMLEVYPKASLVGMISARSQVLASTARTWVREAAELAALPDLAEAYQTGEVSGDQVAALRVLATPDDAGAWVELLASPLSSEDFQISQLHRMARCKTARKLERVDGGRYLKMAATPDERYVDGRFRLHPEEAAALEAELDARVPTTTRWQDYPHAHADALITMVADAAEDRRCGGGPGAGLKATILVRSEHAVLDGTSDTPGALPNGNLVPAEIVRQLAQAGRVHILDLAGIDLNGDDIPAPVRRYIWHRDQGRCRRPDCTTPTLSLEIHHITRNGPLGTHHPRYLVLLCWQCHHTKIHRRGWQVTGNAENTLTWLHPDGSIHTPPPLIRPAHAPDTS